MNALSAKSRTAVIVIVAVVAAGAALGMTGGVGPWASRSSPRMVFAAHPTDAQANSYLEQLAEWAKAGDLASLCAHGTLLCWHNATTLDAMANAPKTPPTVIASRDVPDAGPAQGGRLLAVCGLDGKGEPYRKDLLFFGGGGSWTAIEAVFWVVGFSESHVAAASPSPEGSADCPSDLRSSER